MSRALLLSKTVAQRQRHMGIAPVLSEEIVGAARETHGGHREAPVIAVRLGKLSLDVQAAAVLANSRFDRRAPVGVDRVRSARDDRAGDASIRSEGNGGSVLRRRVTGIAADEQPFA